MSESSGDNSGEDGEAEIGYGSPTGSTSGMRRASQCSSIDEADLLNVPPATNQMDSLNGWDEFTNAPYQQDSNVGAPRSR
jgi:hypothetical protein